MPHFVITGAKSGMTTETIPVRLEINDFIKDQKMFSLYIQALAVMQKTPQDELISFFQIGGIHGMPYVPWDQSEKDKVQSEGYCTHGSVLFPTWHRPYVALFEQVIQSHAVEIAKTYNVGKAEYQEWQRAAAYLRQPYWDWAYKAVPPDEVISLKSVKIITPDGRTTEVENPFLQYTFNPIETTFDLPYKYWRTTLRCPPTKAPNAKTDVDALKRSLTIGQKGITNDTYRLLTRVHQWPQFSNHSDSRNAGVSSLESIHDGIHGRVGGNGHMNDPAVAGFDPIFYLHHCQVDHLLALWSALHPGVWVTKGTETRGTYTIPRGGEVNKDSHLTPFWDAETTFWTSSKAIKTNSLQYIYPEFNNFNLADSDALKDHIAKEINGLYQPQGRSTIFPPVASLSAVASQVSDDEPQATADVAASAAVEEGYWDWSARVSVKKYAVGGSFSVILFMGIAPQETEDWETHPNYVGAHYAFVNSAPERCANCTQQADLVIHGFVSLNDAIAQFSNLASFEPSVVKPYLQQNLYWGVQKADGTHVPLGDVPSLEVTVLATKLTQQPGEPFPVAEEPIFHPDVTIGRPGGVAADV